MKRKAFIVPRFVLDVGKQPQSASSSNENASPKPDGLSFSGFALSSAAPAAEASKDCDHGVQTDSCAPPGHVCPNMPGAAPALGPIKSHVVRTFAAPRAATAGSGVSGVAQQGGKQRKGAATQPGSTVAAEECTYSSVLFIKRETYVKVRPTWLLTLFSSRICLEESNGSA
jgi:hypothetical protein